MKLNLVNTDDVVFKRKFRYSFEGFDKNGKIIFPECIVKLNNRPNFPYAAIADENGGKIISLPGEFYITYFFTMYDGVSGEARSNFDKFNSNSKDVVSGCLTLYDGCGNVLERWKFDGVEMSICSKSEFIDDYNIIAEWLVKYKNGSWQKG